MDVRSATFLSCLYGSEQAQSEVTVGDDFLSCLYGSEPGDRREGTALEFLSCLYGSELTINTLN